METLLTNLNQRVTLLEAKYQGEGSFHLRIPEGRIREVFVMSNGMVIVFDENGQIPAMQGHICDLLLRAEMNNPAAGLAA